MFEVRVNEIADRLYVIDAWMEGRPERLSCYLFDTPERCLIEVGPSNSLENVVAALEHIGVDDVATLLVTHIHIDHAGGAGQFSQRFPKARIGVHKSGARHLVEPSRLWSSASRVYGEEKLARMWGPMVPIPEDRLLVLDEGDTLNLGGGRSVGVMHTPGHAKHHLAFTEEGSGGIFVGDAVGLCYPHGHFVQPVTPPPDFDPELVTAHLLRMAERAPNFLGFAHFGPSFDVMQSLHQAESRLWEWVALTEEMSGLDDRLAAETLRKWVRDKYLAEGYDPDDIDAYDQKTFWPMQVVGIRRWLASRS